MLICKISEHLLMHNWSYYIGHTMFFNSKTKEQQQQEILDTTLKALYKPNADVNRILQDAYKHTYPADRQALYRNLSRRIHPDTISADSTLEQSQLQNMQIQYNFMANRTKI